MTTRAGALSGGCQATAIVDGERLVCDHEQASHPGVMHYDREHDAWWWGDNEGGPGAVRLAGDQAAPQ
jgi:hypothetical protein